MSMPDALLRESSVLFDDTRVEDIDLDEHAPFVIERVIERGTLASVHAMVSYYGRDQLRAFFLAGGARRLSRRSVPLWASYLGLSFADCTSISSAQNRSRFWTS